MASSSEERRSTFLKALETKDSSLLQSTLADAWKTQLTVDAIRHSLEHGRPQEVFSMPDEVQA